MGFDTNTLRLLFYAKKIGIDFSATATIGRQDLHFNSKSLDQVAKSFNINYTPKEVGDIFNKSNGYAEYLLSRFGAKVVHSYDYSSYEGATHVHDMNLPINSDLFGKYSVIIDGGSLEHVFNFPVAIANCMNMVESGGHVICVNPANNFMGHGFYQFSPELFYRVFQSVQGFEVTGIYLIDRENAKKWYSVKNPSIIGSRVLLKNKKPTTIVVIAKKLATVDVFSSVPQQSDYVEIWDRPNKQVESIEVVSKSKIDTSPVTVKSHIRKFLPSKLRSLYWNIKKYLIPFESCYFTPFDPTK